MTIDSAPTDSATPGATAAPPRPSRRRSARGEALRWLAGLVLLTPIFLVFAAHFLMDHELEPTGYIFFDLPAYMAHAREHVDPGVLHLTYSNPNSWDYDAPRIYFQPITLFKGILFGLTGWDLALILNLIALPAALVCARLGIALYEQTVGLATAAHRVGLVLFFWGGGVMVLAGAGAALLEGGPLTDLFRFDPDDGWWFLNFGRNFMFPTEAFYHAWFFGALLAVMARRWPLALALGALGSISHPFTGIQLLLVLGCWAALEQWWLRSPGIPRWFVPGIGALVAFHVGYYLAFLNQFAEHRSLLDNWLLPWQLQAEHMIPAYLLVAGLALWRLRTARLAGGVLSRPAARLLLVWFAVSFLLANHEFAVEPLVPLHFTRGYIWIPLFLLGAPALVAGLAWLLDRRRRIPGSVAVVAIAALFLVDNAVWLAQEDAYHGIRLAPEHRELFALMNEPEYRGHVVLTRDEYVGFLLTAYTPLRPWIGQHFNTPFLPDRRSEMDAFLWDGAFLPQWDTLDTLFVHNRHIGPPELPPSLLERDPALVLETPAFQVFHLPRQEEPLW